MTVSEPIRRPRGEQDMEQYNRICCDAFMATPEQGREYMDWVGQDNVRLLHQGGEVAGGLSLLSMGQYFNGQCVPMVGVAAVAVDVAHRAGGVATRVLKAALEELHASKTPISTLYPATVALYRRVGYEKAGYHGSLRMLARDIDLRDRALTVRPATDADKPQIHETWRRYAARTSGNLERGDFHWKRVEKHRSERTEPYVICNGTEIEGYVYIMTLKEGGDAVLRAHDLAFTTPAAARRLLTFLADYRTTRPQVELWTAMADPLLMHLREAHYQFGRIESWMVRIVHLAAALEARAYPPGLSAELHLCVTDDVLTDNAGDYVLRIADGRGTVARGGRGELSIDIRGLASLYTGYMPPDDLVLAGLAAGPENAWRTAAAAFAGPLPWMREQF